MSCGKLAGKLVLLALMAASCGSNGSGSGTGYKGTVQPIFAAKCVNCHWVGTPIQYQLQNPFDPNTGVVGRATSWNMARHTVVVVPGQPQESFLVDKISATDLNPETEGSSMPFLTAPLTSSEVDAVRTWILNGANNDDSFKANVAPIFGNGTSIGSGAGKCSFCHTAQSVNQPDLVHPFDTAKGVVGVAALVGGTRVIPGDPDHSVLYQKISGGTLPANLKSPMPYQTPKVTATEVAAIQAWIAAGAKND